MVAYYKVEISAETKEQAYDILNLLLEKKLVTGGQIINAPARFLWKGKISDMDYYMVTSFALEKHKEAIIAEVKKVSIEEVPMVTLLPMEGNPELLEWIEETVA
ncbi:MAG TPA: divalent cation tolerance protein CutA [Candidatus Limnocylindria bacterium]|nr:divalent cation tolerance protein CutA [Candidatus Limnocylindria bacterium]